MKQTLKLYFKACFSGTGPQAGWASRLKHIPVQGVCVLLRKSQKKDNTDLARCIAKNSIRYSVVLYVALPWA